MSESLLRHLPKMDLLLAHPILARAGESLPYSALRQAARDTLEDLRRELHSPNAALPDSDTLARRVEERARMLCRPHLRRVINATGVVLHTNLGRAPLAEAAALAAYDAGRGYASLEYDVAEGCRGSRHTQVETLLCQLTGAPAALVVNNNAAAVLLMLTALAGGKGVAVSRGELVEIGGGFRVPDIMARSGCTLMEIGSTNKTRRADYEQAIAQGAGALLKVHTSNYEIVGFTEETLLADLADLARAHKVPLLYDLGSGALSRAYLPALPGCPTVADALTDGADVVCFSGDKLLGGPQAGILVGSRAYIETMRRDPMARAFRMDKLSLAALEATLLLCREPAEALERVPTLSMLSVAPEVLQDRAAALAGRLDRCFCAEVLPVNGQVGGGSMPNFPLPSYAVALTPPDGNADRLEAALRGNATPIVSRIHKGRVLLDVRTLTAEDMDDIVEALSRD